MGRQLLTFLTEMDIEKLVARLQELESFSIVHSRSGNDRPAVVDSPAVEQDDKVWLYYSLVRDDDVDSIVMREVPAQNYWVVDSLRSPVVEFTRSFCDGQKIRAGRLWYEKRYFRSDGEAIQKPQSFLTWADRVFKCARQHLKKSDDYLVGAEACELITSGKLRTVA